MKMSRRKFLGTTTAAVVAGTMAKGQVFGANERIRACCVGIHGQGGSHMEGIMKSDEADLVAVCDVDQKVLDYRAGQVKRETGKEPKKYRDIREALADDAIDCITIATPNHWHTLAAVWACQAGKDVYVEKPLSHSIWEGRQLVAAAEKHGRVVQHGTQSRSNSTLIRDMQLIHEGFIGKIVHSRGYVYKNGNRYAIGHGAPGEAPEELDWNLWQGPAERQDFLINVDSKRKSGLQVHYNWHWFWNYGNGEIGNQGVHEMDLLCWAHDRGLPIRVAATGGRYGWDDDGETPNTHAIQFTYDDGSMGTFEVRNLGSFHEADAGACGNSFYGEKGYYIRGKGFFNYDNEPIPVDREMPPNMDKWQRFFNTMRTRKPEDNPCGPVAGHISCTHCHLGNIAYRLERTLTFDPKTETFSDDSEANAHLKREYAEGFEVPQLA